MTRVLVAGGGVAALEGMLALRRLAEERVTIQLVAPEPEFWYRPLATGEPFGLGTVHGLDLGVLANECGAELVPGALVQVDTDAHLARTHLGAELEYDVLLVATGARPVAAVKGALTFRGPADTDAFERLLGELDRGEARSVVFAIPGGVGWALPVYELALQTAARVDAEVALVTHESAPLGLFGAEASAAVADLLEARGISVRTDAYPVAFANGELELVPGEPVRAERAVAAPRLEGLPIPGLPCNAEGFVPTDLFGRVDGVEDVFAAGDATAFPVKQGGLAAQQADAAASAIAAAAGAPVRPEPFRPVLRGLILTGGAPAYVRSDLAGGVGNSSAAATEALWWPPGKIVGRYLSPFLAERAAPVSC